MVYNGLWTLIERNSYLNELIPENNRIKYETEAQPKESIQDADMPELTLLSGGGGFGKSNNSSQQSCSRQYIWALVTGDLRINPLFNKVQWEIFRSMSDWECVLCELQWCNCPFVEKLVLISTEDGTLMSDLNRNIPGWSSLWTVEVSMQFRRTDLKIKISL